MRERSEIERLLKRAYPAELPLERLMAGLATVASALNANDPGLARIAAVHLRIPDVPSLTARDEMEAVDILIKSADWNPALHPRTGTSPNPGWFAPSGTEQRSPVHVAQNDTPGQRSDALPTIRNESSIRPSLEDVHENPSLLMPVTEKENRQVDAVVAKLKLTNDQRQQLHRALSKLGGVSTYHEVLEIAKDMFE